VKGFGKLILGLLRRGWGDARYALSLVYAYLSYAWSFTRRRPDYVEERWDGLIDLDGATRVAVLNHFDRRGTLHGFVEHYLRELNAAGFAVIFASNAPVLPPATVERLRPLCALIQRRSNAGKDFGAYKDAIAAIRHPERLEALLIANDSVYGPFRPLAEVIAQIDFDRADVWSVTDSWERRFHLQSFFLMFGPRAVRSPAFGRFWSRLRYVQSKRWLISRYEIGLTGAMLAGGLRCRALFPYRSAATEIARQIESGNLLSREDLDATQRGFIAQVFKAINTGVPLNATHFFWDYLIGTMGCPFIKRELLRDNPARIPFLQHWERVIRSVSDYDTDLIVHHLELSLRNRSV